MNHSIYLFGSLESGYTQYPDDLTKDVFQTAVHEISDTPKVTIRRDDSLIYYIYIRPLKTGKESRGQYLGIAISFNGVYYENIKDIFSVFEETLTNIVITGKIVEFTETGDIVPCSARLCNSRTEFERIASTMALYISRLSSDSFKKLPPVNYSGSTDTAVLHETSDPTGFGNAIRIYNSIVIIKNGKGEDEPINSYSDKLRKQNNKISELTAEVSSLSSELVKVKRQKKRTAAVSLLSVIIVIAVVVFVSVGESLSSQVRSLSGNIDILEDIVKDKNNLIEEQSSTIQKYTAENNALKESLSTTKTQLSEAKASISSLTARNASLQQNVTELNSKVSSLSGQNQSLEGQNRSLNSQVVGLKEQLKNCQKTSSTSSTNSYSCSSNAVTIYSKNETVKVGQRIRAQLKDGKITRWEVKSSQSSCVRASGDELIAVGPGTVAVWGYIGGAPRLFNIKIVRK